ARAEVRCAVVEDQEQADKFVGLKGRCPRLEWVIYDDPRGLRGYSEPFLLSLAELQERGAKLEIGHPGYFDDEVAKGTADDLALVCYTSGTTGMPKGAMLSHRNLLVTARNAAAFDGVGADEEILSYLPMAWAGDHIFSYAQSIAVGFAINCPESAATVLPDLKEIAPTYFFAPPGIYERILTQVMIRVEDAAWIKRAAVHFFLRLAQDLERCRLGHQPVSLRQRLLYPLGELLVYRPLKDKLGLRPGPPPATAGGAHRPTRRLLFPRAWGDRREDSATDA